MVNFDVLNSNLVVKKLKMYTNAIPVSITDKISDVVGEVVERPSKKKFVVTIIKWIEFSNFGNEICPTN